MLREGVLDLFFPPRCGGCGRSGGWLCRDCRLAARPLAPLSCPTCSRPCAVVPCPLCSSSSPSLDSVTAWFALEGPIREAVHRLKYEDRPALATHIADLGLSTGELPPGLVVPVPLGATRLRSRGYNQADLLARRVASRSGRGYRAALVRSRETAAQVGRGGAERREALLGAFSWTSPVPEEIVVVDDVVTTGATLMECGRAARAAGVRRVHGLAVALG